MQFRAVRIAEIKAAVMGPAQVLWKRLVQMEDRFDLGIQEGRLAAEIDPAQCGGDQTDIAVGIKHDGFQHPREAIPLFQQRSDLTALRAIPAAHHDVRERFCYGAAQGNPFACGVEQPPFPSSGSPTLSTCDWNLRLQADDEASGEHSALHVSAVNR